MANKREVECQVLQGAKLRFSGKMKMRVGDTVREVPVVFEGLCELSIPMALPGDLDDNSASPSAAASKIEAAVT